MKVLGYHVNQDAKTPTRAMPFSLLGSEVLPLLRTAKWLSPLLELAT
jgi:hypothetical protein